MRGACHAMKIPQEVQCWELYDRHHKQDGGTDRDSRHYVLGWAAAAVWAARKREPTVSVDSKSRVSLGRYLKHDAYRVTVAHSGVITLEPCPIDEAES